jgi:hypothetical protein
VVEAKPVPRMVTLVPEAPLPGESEIDGRTVSAMESGLPEIFGSLRSRTKRSWTPAGAAGTENKQENPPSAVTLVQRAVGPEPQETETREFSQRPAPVRTTNPPTDALGSDSVSEGWTERGADEETVIPPELADRVCDPVTVAGTVTEQENAPREEVVEVDEGQAIVAQSQRMV